MHCGFGRILKGSEMRPKLIVRSLRVMEVYCMLLKLPLEMRQFMLHSSEFILDFLFRGKVYGSTQMTKGMD